MLNGRQSNQTKDRGRTERESWAREGTIAVSAEPCSSNMLSLWAFGGRDKESNPKVQPWTTSLYFVFKIIPGSCLFEMKRKMIEWNFTPLFLKSAHKQGLVVWQNPLGGRLLYQKAPAENNTQPSPQLKQLFISEDLPLSPPTATQWGQVGNILAFLHSLP